MPFAPSLAKRLGDTGTGGGLVALSLHPGGILGTNLGRSIGEEELRDLGRCQSTVLI